MYRERYDDSIADLIARDKGYWVTNGQKFEVEELDNSHLLNIVLMLERKAESLRKQVVLLRLDKAENEYMTFQGSIVDRLIAELETDIDLWLHGSQIMSNLMEELEKRGLLRLYAALHDQEFNTTEEGYNG